MNEETRSDPGLGFITSTSTCTDSVAQYITLRCYFSNPNQAHLHTDWWRRGSENGNCLKIHRKIPNQAKPRKGGIKEAHCSFGQWKRKSKGRGRRSYPHDEGLD